MGLTIEMVASACDWRLHLAQEFPENATIISRYFVIGFLLIDE